MSVTGTAERWNLSEYDRGRRSLATIEQLRFFPLNVAGGKGSWLIDDTGRRLLDLSATWGAASLGYGHPAISSAVNQAMDSPAGFGLGSISNSEATALAEELLETIPSDTNRRVYLGHSGSDANEVVVRALRRATGRRRIVAFHGSYHGGLAGSSAFSGLMVDAGQSRDPDLVLLPYPNSYRPTTGTRDILDQLEHSLTGRDGGAPCAGLILEPVMSDGGMVAPPPGFLSDVAKACHRHGVAVICDEVKVGLGRTGSLHAFQAEGIDPDFVTFGKSLGGGLPTSAAVGPAEVMNIAEAFAMLTTAGNPVCAAAARSVLRTIRNEGLAQQAASLGTHLRSLLDDLKTRHPCIGEIRGRGLALGLDLVKDPSTREPAADVAAKVVYRAWELGVIVFIVGATSNVLEVTPPLVITTSEIDHAVEVLDRALSDVEAGTVPDAAVAGYRGW